MNNVWGSIIIDYDACDANNLTDNTILSAPAMLVAAYSDMFSRKTSLQSTPHTASGQNQSAIQEIAKYLGSEFNVETSIKSNMLYLHMLKESPDKMRVLGKDIRKTLQNTFGLIVSVGFGPNKIVSTVAAVYARQEYAYKGVLYLHDQKQTMQVYHNVRISSIFTIPSVYREFLHTYGCETVDDLRQLTGAWVLKNCGTEMHTIHAQLQCDNSRNGTATSDQYELFTSPLGISSRVMSTQAKDGWDLLPETMATA